MSDPGLDAVECGFLRTRLFAHASASDDGAVLFASRVLGWAVGVLQGSGLSRAEIHATVTVALESSEEVDQEGAS